MCKATCTIVHDKHAKKHEQRAHQVRTGDKGRMLYRDYASL